MYETLKLRPLLTPAPNARGRSKAELGGQRLNVLAACDALLAALEASMPADSDYDSPQAARGEMARDAWRERMGLIQGLRSEIEFETMKIAVS